MLRCLIVCGSLTLLFSPSLASAQDAPPPKVWTAAASAGLALTSGNKDTSTINAAYDVAYDPPSRHLVKSDGLLIRGKTEGELSANRIGLNVRDQFTLTPRAYVYGQNLYLRDEFKEIDYLLAPTIGAGYKVLDTERTKFDVDGGVGAVWEKNPDADVRASGAVTAGEKLVHNLTKTATLTHAVAALWKTEEFADALYTIGVGLAAAVSTRTQLKVELLDTFKNRPPSPAIKKNDVAVLMAIVYKM